MSNYEGGEIEDRAQELAFQQLGSTALGGNKTPFGRSITELLPPDLSRESLLAQLPGTYEGYQNMVAGLFLTTDVGPMPVSIDGLQDAFDAWYTPAKLSFAKTWLESDPSVCFVLTATPSITVDAVALHGLAKLFSKYSYAPPLDSIYEQQSPEVLCKPNTTAEGQVSFSLVATKYFPTTNRQMGKQIKEFARLQRRNPGIEIPSALTALTYVRTLHAHGVQLQGPDVFDLTATRHLDAEMKRDASAQDWRGRPFTLVNMDGQYCLGASNITGLAGLRVAFN